MSSESLHEERTALKPQTLDMHRAIASLMEELEAVDWYAQRVDAAEDEELRDILAHNRDEEKEHAAMILEWIRRRDPGFDAHLRTYLFTEGSITELEEADTGGNADAGATAAVGGGSLGIGSLRGKGGQ